MTLARYQTEISTNAQYFDYVDVPRSKNDLTSRMRNMGSSVMLE